MIQRYAFSAFRSATLLSSVVTAVAEPFDRVSISSAKSMSAVHLFLQLDLGLLVDENRSAKHCLVVTRRPTPTIDDSVKDEHRAPSSGLSATFSPCEGAKGRLQKSEARCPCGSLFAARDVLASIRAGVPGSIELICICRGIVWPESRTAKSYKALLEKTLRRRRDRNA